MIKKIGIALATALFVFAGVGSAFAYEVKPGDTMYTIAKNHGMTVSELAAINPAVNNVNLIYVNQTIKTNSNDKGVSNTVTSTENKVNVNTNITSSDHDLLARLVRAEAQGESYIGKVAVAEVVLNRVNSSQFPNSIQGVIYQGGQFSPVSNGSINRPADADSIRAAKEALNGSNHIGNDALFFYNAHTAGSSWLASRPTTAVIGNHTFKK